jgi:hypothetical protein
VLGLVVLHYGLLAAILVHSIHNALSIPLGYTDLSLRIWRRNRWIYVASLSVIAFLRFVVSDSSSLSPLSAVRSNVVRQELARTCSDRDDST